MKPYFGNIEKETLDNTDYRRVLYTGPQMQLVVMSLKVGEEIPQEQHDDIDQFIRVEKGSAYVKIDEEEFTLSDDDVVIVPSGTKHYVKNTSETEDLKVYTIYTPAEHEDGTVHKTFEEAKEAEHHHHH
ncbi:MAG: cupin domain-containing protein [Nanoarchaeota archaeon]|nr:cupin domain-containing protein [Nanoarchaeota archaeon]